jgi:metallo-beta-lactamase family protein
MSGMKIAFYGGAKSVTGANYLLESDGHKILIDCGLIQGSNFAERQNYEDFPYDPKEIEGVLITHAHIDHIGRLPKLYGDGFRGKVYSTAPTRDFSEVSLLDSEHILGVEAEREKVKPFCTTQNIEGIMDLWEAAPYHEKFSIGPFTAEFFDAGHILGSAIVKITAEGKSIVFSGDLGNYPAPIIQPTENLPEADYCLIESAYGNRVHEEVSQRREMLEDAIEDTVKRGGVLLIPTFALERTQELLYHFHELFEQGRVPRVPVYVDSPLAIKLTGIYKKYEELFNPETNASVKNGDDIMNFPGLHLTLTREESKAINKVSPPKIILAGSGMSQGGRIIHHESLYLSDPKNTILFVGFQARGSLGRQIMEGAPMVRILGEDVPVKAEIRFISSYSAHADQPRLVQWLRPMRLSIKKLFIVQGEEEAASDLAIKVRDELAIDAIVPDPGSEVVL